MKKLLVVASRNNRFTTPLGLIVAAALAVAFWISSGSSGFAQGPVTCDVCHKRTTNLTFLCNSLDYQRHLDHGDTIGTCQVTPTQNP